MLNAFLERLTQDLQLDESIKEIEPKRFSFVLNPDVTVNIQDLDTVFFLMGQIAECPKEKKEDLFILLMKANFLNQGTGGAIIGLDKDENFLTLSCHLPYDMNYQMFKDALEDFVNFLSYWKEKIIDYTKETRSIL